VRPKWAKWTKTAGKMARSGLARDLQSSKKMPLLHTPAIRPSGLIANGVLDTILKVR